MNRSCIAQGRRHRPGQPRGFTLVELMVVMAILALLIALLLPAINGAIRTSRNAAVSAEINQFAQALAQFKSTYGVYPPSRVVLSEDGDYRVAHIQTRLAQQYPNTLYANLSPNQVSSLVQRSVSYLRRVWPRINISTSGPTATYDAGGNPIAWLDFDGNQAITNQSSAWNMIDVPKGSPSVRVLEGAECLVFFLGGIPLPTDSGWTVSGFAKNPQYPAISSAVQLGQNRSPGLFEFRPGRLVDNYPIFLDATGNVVAQGDGFPEYLDGLGGNNPRPYAYFSAYEGQGYDPDDNNYYEDDLANVSQYTFVWGGFSTRSAATPIQNEPSRTDIVSSPAPNPYTASSPFFNPCDYINKNTFQIISAGIDNDFGLGGQYLTDPATTSALPFDPVANQTATTFLYGAATRRREQDNLANFKNGRLE